MAYSTMLTCTTNNTILLIIALKVYIYNDSCKCLKITKRKLYKQFRYLTGRLAVVNKGGLGHNQYGHRDDTTGHELTNQRQAVCRHKIYF